MTLQTVELDATDAVGVVIWLHGLGADGHDFEPIVPMLDLKVALRFIFPHAPERPVTINGGAEMRAWYDIDPRTPFSGSAGTEDIRVSAGNIEELVQAEESCGIPRSKIVLAGFSQGGVIALHHALRSQTRFAGVLALSAYVHDHERLAEEVSRAGIDTPILMAHGQMDAIIPIARAVASREALRALGYAVEWKEYGMGHHIVPQEIADISRWLNECYA